MLLRNVQATVATTAVDEFKSWHHSIRLEAVYLPMHGAAKSPIHATSTNFCCKNPSAAMNGNTNGHMTAAKEQSMPSERGVNVASFVRAFLIFVAWAGFVPWFLMLMSIVLETWR